MDSPDFQQSLVDVMLMKHPAFSTCTCMFRLVLHPMNKAMQTHAQQVLPPNDHSLKQSTGIVIHNVHYRLRVTLIV